jgi:hypothetical protein
MKKFLLLLIIAVSILFFACKKDNKSDRYTTLTTTVWTTDSLLANGVDASDEGEFLAKFKGKAEFYEDGTGYFGTYTGEWGFNTSETEITIYTSELVFAIICRIVELTPSSLKITTTVPDPVNTSETVKVRMTFKPI